MEMKESVPANQKFFIKPVEACIMLDIASVSSDIIVNNNAYDLCLLFICYIGNTLHTSSLDFSILLIGF